MKERDLIKILDASRKLADLVFKEAGRETLIQAAVKVKEGVKLIRDTAQDCDNCGSILPYFAWWPQDRKYVTHCTACGTRHELEPEPHGEEDSGL